MPRRLHHIENLIEDQIKRHGCLVAALIDPDEFSPSQAAIVAKESQRTGVSIMLVGGSTAGDQNLLDQVVMTIKKHTRIPVILFPGNITGVSRYADAILFSSLLNSDNPYFIIGAQSLGALQIHRYHLEAIPMAYIVFGDDSTTGFVGQARKIPLNKPDIAVMYALAARYMGMRAIYLEGGSGATSAIPPQLVKAVRKHFPGLILVGGGIKDAQTAFTLAKSGADILIIGNLLQAPNFKDSLKAIIRATKKRL